VLVLICPDKFAGSISAAGAAAAIARGWAAAAPRDDIRLRPLADGGTGFIEVLTTSMRPGPDPARRITVPTTDPLGRPVTGEILVTGGTAYVECAQAAGLHLLEPAERDPNVTTTYGVGALVTAAITAGAREIVIGLGGTGTNDGGAGFLAALGRTPVDSAGVPLPPGGAALSGCAGLRRETGAVSLEGIRLVAATDVDSPLTGLYGASSMFGPQKGADRADVLRLDVALAHWAGVLERDLQAADVEEREGAGAAGGLGAAIFALGGEARSGIRLVQELTGFAEALDDADLVITGEGSLDAQSLHGKLISGVAAAARDRGLPCVVLAGRSSAGRRECGAAGVTDVYTLVDHFGSAEIAMARADEGLAALASRLAGQWSR